MPASGADALKPSAFLPVCTATCLLVGATSLFFVFTCPWLAATICPAVPPCCAILFLFVLANFTMATFMDAGVLPVASEDEDKDDGFRAPLYKNVDIKGVQVRMKWCASCHFYRPPRCSHCSVCDHCVEDFDHHCPWVNNCIGRRNYRYFFLFLLSLTFHMVAVFTFGLIYVLHHMNDLWKLHFTVTVVVISISGLFLLPVLGLTGFHLYLVSRGRTTNEQVTGKFQGGVNPFTQGCCNNMEYLVCSPISPKYMARPCKTKIVHVQPPFLRPELDQQMPMKVGDNGLHTLALENKLLKASEQQANIKGPDLCSGFRESPVRGIHQGSVSVQPPLQPNTVYSSLPLNTRSLALKHSCRYGSKSQLPAMQSDGWRSSPPRGIVTSSMLLANQSSNDGPPFNNFINPTEPQLMSQRGAPSVNFHSHFMMLETSNPRALHPGMCPPPGVAMRDMSTQSLRDSLRDLVSQDTTLPKSAAARYDNFSKTIMASINERRELEERERIKRTYGSREFLMSTGILTYGMRTSPLSNSSTLSLTHGSKTSSSPLQNCSSSSLQNKGRSSSPAYCPSERQTQAVPSSTSTLPRLTSTNSSAPSLHLLCHCKALLAAVPIRREGVCHLGSPEIKLPPCF
uniref:Palmitoyltransferase n=1 Tax=Oryzias latipes TaxID=8090 RepID=A0A3P9IYB7_ORYLA